MRPSTAFAVAVGIVAVLALCGGGGLVAVLVMNRPTAGGTQQQAQKKGAEAEPREPKRQTTNEKYRGRSLVEWVGDFNDRDPATHGAAVEALIAFGRPAVKPAVDALESSYWDDACWVLQNIGADAKDALPALKEQLRKNSRETNVGFVGPNGKGQVVARTIDVIEGRKRIGRD